MQAAASGNLVDRLAAHVEALWPMSEAVAALASGDRASSTHAQATRPGERCDAYCWTLAVKFSPAKPGKHPIIPMPCSSKMHFCTQAVPGRIVKDVFCRQAVPGSFLLGQALQRYRSPQPSQVALPPRHPG